MVCGEKIAGILAESKWIGQTLIGVALGVGMNLNMSTKELSDIDKKEEPKLSISYVNAAEGNVVFDTKGFKKGESLAFKINGEEKNIEVDGDLTIYGIGRAFKVHPKIEIN